MGINCQPSVITMKLTTCTQDIVVRFTVMDFLSIIDRKSEIGFFKKIKGLDFCQKYPYVLRVKVACALVAAAIRHQQSMIDSSHL